MRKKSLITVFISTLVLGFFSANVMAAEMPEWIEKTSLNGEVTLRYQVQKRDNVTPTRDQGMIKAVLGVQSEISDDWKVGVGIITSNDNNWWNDPRSTAQSLNGTFDRETVDLDHAYAQYTHNSGMVSVIMGKFNNPIYQSRDFIWDTDINPEGIAATFNFKPMKDIDLDVFVTPGYYMFDEYSDRSDPTMMAIQAGLNWKIDHTAYLKFATAYYVFNKVQGNQFWKANVSTNTTDAFGDLIYDYDTFALDLELGYYLNEMANNKVTEMVPFFAFFTQLINSDAYEKDMGFMVGAKVGYEKIEEFGQWQFIYNFSKLEKDAWLDFLPNNEFYGGETAVRGNEAELKIGIKKNITFGLDYYSARPMNRNFGEKEYLLKADLVFKF